MPVWPSRQSQWKVVLSWCWHDPPPILVQRVIRISACQKPGDALQHLVIAAPSPCLSLRGPGGGLAPFPLCCHPVHPRSRAGRRWVLWHPGQPQTSGAVGLSVVCIQLQALPCLCPSPSPPAQLSLLSSCSQNMPWLCCLGRWLRKLSFRPFTQAHLPCGFAFTTNF